MNAFAKCHEVVHRWERGYSNHPKDPGGATQDGVTQRVYDAYRLTHKLPVQDVRRISREERMDIYRRQYWDAVQGELLPPGIDLAVYDFAVNSGVSRATRHLQAALGVKVDGHIGQVTLKAARDAWERGEAGQVVQRIMDGREKFLRGLSTWKHFGKGWSNRLQDVGKEARLRAAASRKSGPTATTVAARAPDDADAYNPAKACASPPDKAKDAGDLLKKAATIGTAGAGAAGAAAQMKDIFGDLVSPSILLAIIIMVMIGVVVLALLKLKEADA